MTVKGRIVAVAVLAVLIVTSFALAAPVNSTAAKKRSDLSSMVMANLDMELARKIIEDLQEIGSAKWLDGSNMGFRGAGSQSSHQASMYVLDVMKEIGLSNPKLELIPVDAWEFRGAWVKVGDLQLQAASYGGSTPTNGEITAELVDVGNGFHSGYEGVDVQGKIVLANWIGNDYWVDSMAAEAYYHGASAIIVTTYDSDYGNTPGAIECHDGLYRLEWPPMLSISGQDGLLLKDMLAEAKTEGRTLEVTVWSDIIQTPMNLDDWDAGGFGYNVMGVIPGKNYGQPQDEFLILGDHTDAWFYGGMDDNSGVAATLVLAKALKLTFDQLNTKPDRTIIVVTHEAEEYGVLGTYYDWCWGANFEVTKLHPEWVGRSVAYMNFELMGAPGTPLAINMAPELVSFVHKVLGQNKARLPYGFKVAPVPHTWADHWTYSAAGIPGIELETVDDEWDSLYYHNQFDTIALIDFEYLRMLFEVYADMAARLISQPIIPYNFETSAARLMDRLMDDDEFGVAVLRPIYEQYGLDPEKNMGRALDAAERFLANAGTLKLALKRADPAKAHEINEKLMQIEYWLGTSLIAMGVWEQDWYPYQQPANDVVHMDAAIDMLTDPSLSDDTITDAIWELNWVGIIWYYDYMCKPNYLDQYAKLCGEDVKSWGLQTHLRPVPEIWEQYDALNALAYDEDVVPADVEPIVSDLRDILVNVAFYNLEMGFEDMWKGLEEANSLMESLLAAL